MKKIAIIIFICSLLINLYAGDPGTKSLTFLNIAPNACVAGMGESFTALADDVSCVYWNPAGLAVIKNMEVGVNYNLYFEEMSYMNLQFAGDLGFGDLGVNVSTFQYGDIDNYVNGTLSGSISPSDLLASVSYGFALFKNVYLGLTGKYISEKLTDDYKGTSIAGDGGILIISPLGSFLKPLQFGAVLQNIGMGPKFDTDSNDLPVMIKTGLAYKIRLAKALAKLKDINLSCDVLLPSDADLGVRIGTELWWYHLPGGLDAAIRAGLKAPQDLGFSSGLTFGGGIRAFNLEVDYALVNFGDLGTTHRVGMTYKFGKIDKPIDDVTGTINEFDKEMDEDDFDFEDRSKELDKKKDLIKDKKDKAKKEARRKKESAEKKRKEAEAKAKREAEKKKKEVDEDLEEDFEFEE